MFFATRAVCRNGYSDRIERIKIASWAKSGAAGWCRAVSMGYRFGVESCMSQVNSATTLRVARIMQSRCCLVILLAPPPTPPRSTATAERRGGGPNSGPGPNSVTTEPNSVSRRGTPPRRFACKATGRGGGRGSAPISTRKSCAMITDCLPGSAKPNPT